MTEEEINRLLLIGKLQFFVSAIKHHQRLIQENLHEIDKIAQSLEGRKTMTTPFKDAKNIQIKDDFELKIEGAKNVIYIIIGLLLMYIIAAFLINALGVK